MRLKATKTSLYKLVAMYAAPPSMKKTEFVKAYRTPSYWLEWGANGKFYKVFISACMGKPLLSIDAKEYNEETGRYEITNRQTHTLTIQDLRERGMIEEQATVNG